MTSPSQTPAPKPARPTPRSVKMPPRAVEISHNAGASNPPVAAQTVSSRVVLRNPLRRTSATITLFAEGSAEIQQNGAGADGKPFRLDLRYLDPVAVTTRVVATRAKHVAIGAGVLAWAAAALAQLPALASVALPAAFVAAAVVVIATGVALYRSYERVEFRTIHGRACVLSLVAGFGSIRQLRAFVPVLTRAIDESLEKITEDTSTFLRAEIREHYRLRGDGVLSPESCTEGTGRILAQFEIEI